MNVPCQGAHLGVRGNGGDSTPVKLLGALINVPFWFSRSIYRVSYALPDARLEMARHDSAFYHRKRSYRTPM